MRQIKISSVQYQMLVALGKRWRMKPEELIAELIEENYKSKAKQSDESTCPQQVLFYALLQGILCFSIYRETVPNGK